MKPYSENYNTNDMLKFIGSPQTSYHLSFQFNTVVVFFLPCKTIK